MSGEQGYEVRSARAVGVVLPEAPSMFKVGLVTDRKMRDGKRRFAMVEYDDRMHLYRAWHHGGEGDAEIVLAARWNDAEVATYPACYVPDFERSGRWLNCEALWCDAAYLAERFGTPQTHAKLWERMSNGGALTVNLVRCAAGLPLLRHGGAS